MPIGIDLFSGAGGLSLGAEMAGFQVKFAVEKDKSAAMTYRHNHPNTLVLEDDIHNIWVGFITITLHLFIQCKVFKEWVFTSFSMAVNEQERS